MKAIIFLIIAAILAGLSAIYVLFGESDLTVENESGVLELVEQSDKETAVEKFAGEASLMEIFSLNKSLECKISYVPPDMIEPIIGTYFVANGKMRGDFEISSPEFDVPFVSSIINDGEMFYSWSKIAGESYGVKINTASFAEADSDTLREPVPSDVNVSYDCTEWRSVDGSVFEPPSDVLFQDLNDIMESGMEFGTIYEEEF